MRSTDPTVSRPFVPRDLSEIQVSGFVRLKDNLGQTFAVRRFPNFLEMKKTIDRFNEIEKPDGHKKFITVMFDERENIY